MACQDRLGTNEKDTSTKNGLWRFSFTQDLLTELRTNGASVPPSIASADELSACTHVLCECERTPAYARVQVRTRISFAPFDAKNTIILPRQARDKHRETSQKEMCFLTAAARGPGRAVRERAVAQRVHPAQEAAGRG
jgi:hypothetical protein